MSSTRDDLDSFHRFAVGRLAGGDSAASLDELFRQWHDSRSRDEVNHAIHQGLADVKSGRCETADRAMESICREFGFGMK